MDFKDGPIPVWATVAAAYREVFVNFGAYARLALKPLLLGIGLLVVGVSLATGLYVWIGAEAYDSVWAVLAGYVILAPSIAAFMYFSLWSVRRRLLGHDAVSPFGKLAFGVRERRYIGLGLAALFFPILISELSPGFGLADTALLRVTAVAEGVIATVVVAPFALMFPSIAADAPNPFHAGWRAARGSWLSLAVIYLLAEAAISPIYLVPGDGSADPFFAGIAVFYVAFAIPFATAVIAVALADAYRWKCGSSPQVPSV